MSDSCDLAGALYSFYTDYCDGMSCETFIGLVFYKCLSDLELLFLDGLSCDGDIGASCRDGLGYFISPVNLLGSVADSSAGSLRDGFEEVYDSSRGLDSASLLKDIFVNVDLDFSHQLLVMLNGFSFGADFGECFTLLVNMVLGNDVSYRAFITPLSVSRLFAGIISADRPVLASVYDGACGVASSLVELSRSYGGLDIFGQDISAAAYNIGRMNIFINTYGVHIYDVCSGEFSDESSDFSSGICLGDVLENPMHLDMKFDSVVSVPPFGVKWSYDSGFRDDVRFRDTGIPSSRSNADYAFIQHMLYQLNDDGVMCVLMPHGVLFREGLEYKLRRHILGMNCLDAVIGLPSRLLPYISIPTVVLVFKKSRVTDNILFIDASEGFESAKPLNVLGDDDINRIIAVYRGRSVIDRYSYIADIGEIADNDYNLNIPLYVDTYIPEEISLEDTLDRINTIKKRLNEIDEELDKYYSDILWE